MQGQQHEPSTDRSQVDQSTSGARVVHDLQSDAQDALESLQKVVQRLDQDPEQPGRNQSFQSIYLQLIATEFDRVGLDALSGLENELSSIVDYFQTLSVRLDGMSEEITHKMIDLRQSEDSCDQPATEHSEFIKELVGHVGSTETGLSLFEDFSSNFILPTMQRVESLEKLSDSDERKDFQKYYRDAMKGYTEATQSLAEKSSDEIQDLLEAGISVVGVEGKQSSSFKSPLEGMKGLRQKLV